MSKYHIILSRWRYITNRYCSSSSHHLCTTWGMLVSDLNFFCSPLQSEITMNAAPYTYLLNFTMYPLSAAASPKKLYLEFPVATTLISRWNKFSVGAVLSGTCQIRIFRHNFLVIWKSSGKIVESILTKHIPVIYTTYLTYYFKLSHWFDRICMMNGWENYSISYYHNMWITTVIWIVIWFCV